MQTALACSGSSLVIPFTCCLDIPITNDIILSWRWSQKHYVAIKVHGSNVKSRDRIAQNKLDMLKHITKTNPKH